MVRSNYFILSLKLSNSQRYSFFFKLGQKALLESLSNNLFWVQLMFQQIRRLNWLVVIDSTATLHCLLDPFRRYAFLHDLVVDAVKLICLLVFENLLTSLMPIRLRLDLELDIIDGRFRAWLMVRITILDTQFLKHSVRTASVFVSQV